MTEEPGLPTSDPLDTAMADLSASQLLVYGLVGLLLGGLLFRAIRPLLRSRESPPLAPHPAIDLATVMVGLGSYAVAVVLAVVVFGLHSPTDAEPSTTDGEPAAEASADTPAPPVEPDEAQEPDEEEPLDADTVRRGMFATALSQFLTVGVLLAFLRQRGAGPEALGLRVSRPAVQVGRGILAYLCVFPAMTGATTLWAGLLRLLDREPQAQVAVQSLHEIGADPAFLVSTVLVVPFCEEVLFRGLLLAAVLRLCRWRRWPPPVGVVIAAALFAGVHDAGQATVFVLGLALCVLYRETRSLAAPIALHACHNALVAAIVLNSGSSP